MSERLGTHWETCWQSATHHGCALTRIASLERQLEDAKAQLAEQVDERDRILADWNEIVRVSGSKTHGGAIGHVANLVAQLAERTRERDRARSYCAELASYVCEPIYDDVRNRAGIAADASAAAGDEMSMRWHDVQRAQARAESAERSLEEARKDAERYRWLRGDAGAHSLRWPRWRIENWTGAFWDPLQDVTLDAAIDSAIEAEKGATDVRN